MNNRVILLFGPYRPPALQVGDRATCLYKDCLVVVTSWTDAHRPRPGVIHLDLVAGVSQVTFPGLAAPPPAVGSSPQGDHCLKGQ
jgi:hypothetical protein